LAFELPHKPVLGVEGLQAPRGLGESPDLSPPIKLLLGFVQHRSEVRGQTWAHETTSVIGGDL
jgi:hypothetical protein